MSRHADPAVRSLGYVSALDGVRAFAVLAVVCFHAGFGWAGGGFLGVSVFFTLSGFLITSLLLAEHAEQRTISLRRFYSRRVRRLLPASYLCMALVLVATPWWSAVQRRRLPGDVLAALGNVYNWRAAWSSVSYRQLFDSAPSPLAHFWSLSIEEQCYLVLPLVTVVVLRRGGRRWLTAAAAGLLVASLASALLTTDFDLGYNATFTRVGEVLAGMLLATLIRGRRVDGEWGDVVGLASLAILAVGIALLGLDDQWLARGGLLGVGVVSCGLIVGVLGNGPLASAFSWRPLVALGRVSYGVYLFHWPVFQLLTEQRTGLGRWPLLAVRALVTAAVTIASYHLLERPIRERRWLVSPRHGAVALGAAAAVLVGAVWAVPTPGLSETEQLLADANGGPVLLTPGTDDAPTSSAPIERARVLVVGSNPEGARLLQQSSDRFDVVNHVRVECPVASGVAAELVSGEIVSTEQCADSGEVWVADIAVTQPDVVLVSFGALDDGLVRTADDTSFPDPGNGYQRERMAGRVRARVGASLQQLVGAGVRVILYWPIDPAAPPFAFRDYSIESGQIDGPFDNADDVLAALDAAVAPLATTDATRVLVIGDSTSFFFAVSLSRTSSNMDVQWAGRNGCPFVPVDALQSAADTDWIVPEQCPLYATTVPDLLTTFDADVVIVVLGAMELTVQRYPGDPTGYAPGSPGYVSAHDEAMQQLLDALGPDGPLVLVADSPPIKPGPFSTDEMSTPERVAALNSQIQRWAQQHPGRVEVLPYTAPLLAYEAEHGWIREDGSHPDVDLLTGILRDAVVPVLLDRISAAR